MRILTKDKNIRDVELVSETLGISEELDLIANFTTNLDMVRELSGDNEITIDQFEAIRASICRLFNDENYLNRVKTIELVKNKVKNITPMSVSETELLWY